MMKSVPGFLAVALCFGASSTAMHAANLFQGNGTSVFVMTNDNDKNEILTYQRDYNAQFELKARIPTGGRGSGGTVDPLQSQVEPDTEWRS